MRYVTLLIALILIFFVYLNFSRGKEIEKHPGICLSFDDRSIDEWFELRKLFNDNNIRVTFFITQPDSLTNNEIHKLRILQKDGHEIGFHGTLHVLSNYYIKEKSYSDYLDNEINIGMKIMDSLGFNCTSFAYPYGAKYWFTDFLLLDKFDFLRGVSPLPKGGDLSKVDDIYYSFNGDKTLSAIGFDNISGLTHQMIDTAIGRVIVNKEVLLLFAHTPESKIQDNAYFFKIELLKYMIQQATERKIKFYTIRELYN